MLVVLFVALWFTACDTGDGVTDPDIADFTFTPTAGLREGNDNVSPGKIAGTFRQTTESGGTGIFTYALAEGVDNASFELDADSLKIKGAALSGRSYTVGVVAEDVKGKTLKKNIEFEVAVDNTVLQGFTFAATGGLQAEEANTAADAVVGTFTDPTNPDYTAFAYALAADPANQTNDADNSSFDIYPGTKTLKVKEPLTEGKTYKIYVQITGTTVTGTEVKGKGITFAVTAPVPPVTGFDFIQTVGLKHETDSIRAGAIAGTFSQNIEEDGGDREFTYTLVAAPNDKVGTDDDNSEFIISYEDLPEGKTALLKVKTNKKLDAYETGGGRTYKIYVQVTDRKGNTAEKNLTVFVTTNYDELNARTVVGQELVSSVVKGSNAAAVPAGTEFVSPTYWNEVNTLCLGGDLGEDNLWSQLVIDTRLTNLNHAISQLNSNKAMGTMEAVSYKFLKLNGGTVTGSDTYGTYVFDFDLFEMALDTGVFIAGRNVTLSDFWIGETEISYKKWLEVRSWAMDAVGRGEDVYNIDSAGQMGGKSSNDDADQPVTQISWRDAIVWCNAYSEYKSKTPVYYDGVGKILRDSSDEKGDSVDNAVMDLTKNGFRLPTEAEWEYAARGGDTTKPDFLYHFAGATVDDAILEEWFPDEDIVKAAIANYVWYSPNKHPTTTTCPVGSTTDGHLPNIAGLYDMSGNVAEFCWDKYNPGFTLVTGTNPTGPDNYDSVFSNARVVRGGDAATESFSSFLVTHEDGSYMTSKSYARGFRVVCKTDTSDTASPMTW